MEEKTNKKGMLIFLIIVIIILIAIIGGLIYYMIIEKQEQPMTVSNASNEAVQPMENAAKQNEAIDNSVKEETVKEENAIVAQAKARANTQTIINFQNQEFAKEGPYILKHLGLIDDKEITQMIKKNGLDKNNYFNTEIKFEDFKTIMLDYMTEDYFYEYFATFKDPNAKGGKREICIKYKNVDGNLYAFIGGGASGRDEQITDMTLKSENKDSNIYTVKTKWENANETMDTRTLTVEIKNVNGKYVVDEIK